MLLSFATPDLVKKIKKLIPEKTINLTAGTDHLDYLSFITFNSYDYWAGLAAYNDIINPFNLVDQNIQSIKVFSKYDYDRLIRENT